MQNYGPYQAQSQFGIPICYVIISDVNQFHLPLWKENTDKIEINMLHYTGATIKDALLTSQVYSVFLILKSRKELHSGCKWPASVPFPPTLSWKDSSAVTTPADLLPVPNILHL